MSEICLSGIKAEVIASVNEFTLVRLKSSNEYLILKKNSEFENLIVANLTFNEEIPKYIMGLLLSVIGGNAINLNE